MLVIKKILQPLNRIDDVTTNYFFMHFKHAFFLNVSKWLYDAIILPGTIKLKIVHQAAPAL